MDRNVYEFFETIAGAAHLRDEVCNELIKNQTSVAQVCELASDDEDICSLIHKSGVQSDMIKFFLFIAAVHLSKLIVEKEKP